MSDRLQQSHTSWSPNALYLQTIGRAIRITTKFTFDKSILFGPKHFILMGFACNMYKLLKTSNTFYRLYILTLICTHFPLQLYSCIVHWHCICKSKYHCKRIFSMLKRSMNYNLQLYMCTYSLFRSPNDLACCLHRSVNCCQAM